MARGKWLSGTERERILQLQREGLGVSAIAARVNRSYHFVYRHLRDKCRVKHGRDEDDLALHQDTTEIGDDSCEPLSFDTLVPSGLLPFDLPSHVDKMQNASASGLLLPLEEIYDGESLLEPSAEPPGSSKPCLRWMNLNEDPPAPTHSVGLIEPEQEVAIANSDLPGLHSSLQGAIRRLSRQRSISLGDAQLLQLLAQANVILLSREQSSTRDFSPSLWGCEPPR